jgi:putative serine protease PepD
MKGPRHLWTGDWRSDSSDAAKALADQRPRRRRAGDEAPTETPDAGAPAATETPPRGTSRRAKIAAGLAGLALIGGGAYTIGAAVGGDEKPANTNTTAAAPAADNTPLKPRKGQTRAGAVYEAASPAVVSVRTGSGSGTAFLVGSDGTLVTNNHVVSNSNRVVVRFGRDNDSIDAQVLGRDPSTDLAVLKIPASSIPANVKPLKFADSRNVRVGDAAIAIGSPFGLDRTATEGIVSAVDRAIEAPNGFSIDSVIQTDAPINPGNSGGPLLNDSANVIGVTSQIATAGAGGGNVGIGFAVPSNTVRDLLPRLKQGQTIERAYLGVQTSAPVEAGSRGAEIRSMVTGGPADQAGLHQGDIIRRVDSQTVTDPTKLSGIVSRHQPGDKVDVVIDRNGQQTTVQVTLGRRPSTSTP